MPLHRAATCARCHHAVDLIRGASGHTGMLRSWVAYHCLHCGQSMEGEGVGPLPPDERLALLAAEGEYTLRVDEEGERALQATQQLRALLDLPMARAMAMRRSMPGRVFSGLQAECEWLAVALTSTGWRASVEPP
ncbi:MAG: hypothetical protein EOO74_12295 [Myxococcales bacterium]|nr:MAG: hypothetical protein EOO74_12295 [Myxococcales bacterium]